MRGRHLRRRFSLQPSFMKDDHADDKTKRDKVGRNNAVDDAIGPTNARHKIVVMGAAKVGKTSIITQFLYNTFTTKYKRTIEEMHQGNFSIAGVSLTLDILDTAGSYETELLLVKNHLRPVMSAVITIHGKGETQDIYQQAMRKRDAVADAGHLPLVFLITSF
ncbi:dexamethasone-induced Ras-related protein 1-like [Musca domestica]|uniref:Dexamethasone-induced Ras-related protein 1-like n=1 Tax=Musca domestica TaxID=7370 RepID=A0ABM3UN87_MUSDO|nr:dexamethasone-induced Ras-related protein 1-like [Musca domestica]